MTKALIALMLMWGATPDVVEMFSKEYTSEKVSVLVTRATARKLHQVEVLGYFPRALFFYKNSLRVPTNTYASPAHLTLDARAMLQTRDYSKTLKLGFEKFSGTPAHKWHLPRLKVADFLRKNGVEIDDEFEVLHRGKNPDNADPVTVTAGELRQFYILKKGVTSYTNNEGKNDYVAPETSIYVAIGPDEKIKETLETLRKGMSPEDESRLLGEVKNDSQNPDWQRAWNAGRAGFGQHYVTYWLTGTTKYNGPDEPGAPAEMGDLAVMTHFHLDLGFVTLPVLDKSDAKEGGERKVFQPIRLHTVSRDWRDSEKKFNLKHFDVDADGMIQSILGPQLGEGIEVADLKPSLSVDKEGNPTNAGNVCLTQNNVNIIRFTWKDEKSEVKFNITDKSEVPDWEISMKLLENTPQTTQFVGEFYPVKVSQSAVR